MAGGLYYGPSGSRNAMGDAYGCTGPIGKYIGKVTNYLVNLSCLPGRRWYSFLHLFGYFYSPPLTLLDPVNIRFYA